MLEMSGVLMQISEKTLPSQLTKHPVDDRPQELTKEEQEAQDLDVPMGSSASKSRCT